MDSKQTIQYLIIAGFMVQYGAAQTDCGPINLAISTNVTNTTGPYMTYVDRSTYIHCNFTCDVSCTKVYLYWRKDRQVVYRLDFAGGSTGPDNGYEDRVGVVTKDDENGIYVMEWMDTNWNDTLGQDYASWDCYIRTDICRNKEDQYNVAYYKFPELVMYADGNPVHDFEHLEDEKGTAKCTVMSYPESRITMMRRNTVLADNSSCSPFSQHEFICFVQFVVEFNKGFECNVTYNSPETGAYEEVIPDGCCTGGLYPTTPPPSQSLEGWEIALIVIGCLAAVGLLVGGVIYYKKHQGDGKKKAGGENKAEKSVGKGVASDRAEDQQPATANQSASSTPQSSPSPSQRSQTRSANDESKQRRLGESKSSDK